MIKVLPENKLIIDIDVISISEIYCNGNYTVKIRHTLLAINHNWDTQTAQFYKVYHRIWKNVLST